ncbi:winged helix-turn-helix transcriptional regulator [Advenella kashmirensis]
MDNIVNAKRPAPDEQPSCFALEIPLEETGFGYTLARVSGKYKMTIMYWLSEHKPVLRFNELQRCIGTISYKTLSTTLKEMERDGLVIRKEYPQIPPKVEYSLSERGQSLLPVINLMCTWGEAQLAQQNARG